VRNAFSVAVVLAACLASAPLRAQEPVSTAPPQGNLDAYVEVLRSDVRASKTALVTQALQLTDSESAAFWPIYREYDNELAKTFDKRFALIKDYAAGYGSIDETKADQLADRLLKIEEERIKLRRQYFQKIKKAIHARKAARWLQVENRVGLLIDLQIASELPLLN
jgi:hypothetical protein